jgi:o-succinylbenzoate synthase
MALKASFSKKVFQFSFEARTSRGLMKDKTSWFINVWDERNPDVVGVGECGPLPDLSIDARPDFEDVVAAVVEKISVQQHFDGIIPKGFPSITFGVETALLDLSHGGKRIIFDNDFNKGTPIPINGLVWMGDKDFMRKQIDQKIAQGFRCIKLKVGGLDFEEECDVLQYIRKKYFREDIAIRLDANGAFAVQEVFLRLHELAKFNVHSIEQPVKPGLPEMEEICRNSPIPIALDEELIGKETHDAKLRMLSTLKPQFIILKPTLHGGFSGSKVWIEVAERLGIAWWITSALESNIGLNAICQFTANYRVSIPQGLGTGAIYENNIASPLTVAAGNIFYDNLRSWGSLSVIR